MPLKRDVTLAPLSREHHQALVMCRALERGAPTRLRERYPSPPAERLRAVQRAFVSELEPHFEVEERVLVPLCQPHDELRALADRVLQDHAELRRQVAELSADAALEESLDGLARKLETHVRFEERTWFESMQRVLGPSALAAIATQMQPVPMRAIESFAQDDDGDWFAMLVCGHAQHVRHRPPFQSREWVTTAEGREDKVGWPLPCRLCMMPSLPEGLTETRRTDTYDETTVPKGLLQSHRLRGGSFAEIVVERGTVLYVLEDEQDRTFVLTPRARGIVAPERPHHIEPQAGSRFYLRFLRAPAPGA